MAAVGTLVSFSPSTVIRSADVNQNFTDLKTAINTAVFTDTVCTIAVSHVFSAVQKFADGAVGAPGITFNSDTDCGLYRIGANNIGIAVNGAKVLDVGVAGLGVTGTFSVSGVATLSAQVNIAATSKLCLDGGGDTYIRESSANSMVFTAGGTDSFFISSGVGVFAGGKFFFDGGGDTYAWETSANLIELVAGGVAAARLDASVTGGDTRLFVYDVTAAALKRVLVGAAGTGPIGGTSRALYLN
jgi:hypothetical protein